MSMNDRRRDTWMTAEEAAAYLGYRTRDALYQAVRRGHVPAHHLGPRRLRFRKGESMPNSSARERRRRRSATPWADGRHP